MLQNLTDKELQEYHKLYIAMNNAGNRNESRKTTQADTKFLYHIIRLLSEVEQILSTGDLDLEETGRREHMKAVRRGDISQADIEKWFAAKELALEKLYANSTLPHSPDEGPIKQLLLRCLEVSYGSLDKAAIVQADKATNAICDIQKVMEKYGY